MDSDKIRELEELQNRTVITKDDSIDIDELEEKVAQNDPEAMLTLGECYYNAVEVPYDYDKAFLLFQKAAEMDNAEAQCYLGRCYLLGQGVFADEAKAAQWFEKSAANGSVLGSAFLGTAYLMGSGVQVNYKKARHLLQYAAEGDNAGAEFLLAVMYFDGIGVYPIYDKTIYWCRRAIEQENEDAMELLAICYFEGLGPVKTDWIAFSLLYYLANKGRARSQYYLGQCFERGIAVKKDKKEARGWYKLALEGGFHPADERLKKTKFPFGGTAKIVMDEDQGEFNQKIEDQFFDLELLSPPFATFNEKPFYGEDVEGVIKLIDEVLEEYDASDRKDEMHDIMFSQDDKFLLDEEGRYLYMLIVKKLVEKYVIVGDILNDRITAPENLKELDQQLSKKISEVVYEKNEGINPFVAEGYMEYFREPLYTITNTGRIKDANIKLNEEFSQHEARVAIEKELIDHEMIYRKNYCVTLSNGEEVVTDFLIISPKGVYTVNISSDPFYSKQLGSELKFFDNLKATAIDGYAKAKVVARTVELHINERLGRSAVDFNYILPKALVCQMDDDIVSSKQKRRVFHYTKLIPYLEKIDSILSDDEIKEIVDEVDKTGKSLEKLKTKNFRKNIIDLSLSLRAYYDKLTVTSLNIVDFVYNMDMKEWKDE